MKNTISQPQIRQPIFNNTLLIPTQKTDIKQQHELDKLAKRMFGNNHKKLQKNAIRLNKIYTPKSLNNSDYLAYMQPINSVDEEIKRWQQRASKL